jgi:DNA polymerase-3 subunit delta
VYLLDGGEEFLLEEALRDLVDEAVAEEAKGFNLDVFESAAVDMRDVLAVASSFPMMSERRVVILRNIDKLGKDDTERLTSYVERPLDSTILVLTCGKADNRRKMVKVISAAGGGRTFKPLSEPDLPGWIARRATRKQIKIDEESCRLLASMVGKSLRELDMELDKLALYAGKRDAVTEGDIRTVVGVSRQYNVFELQKAIAVRDQARALEIVTKLAESGQGAPVLTSVLTGFFSVIWRMFEWKRKGLTKDQMCGELKYPPNSAWRLQDHEAAMRRFSQADVEKALSALMTVDERCKGGGDEHVLLTTMMTEIVGVPASVLDDVLYT